MDVTSRQEQICSTITSPRSDYSKYYQTTRRYREKFFETSIWQMERMMMVRRGIDRKGHHWGYRDMELTGGNEMFINAQYDLGCSC